MPMILTSNYSINDLTNLFGLDTRTADRLKGVTKEIEVKLNKQTDSYRRKENNEELF